MYLEHLEAARARLDGEVDTVISPFAQARDRLDTITGVGKRAAESIIAEIGVDVSVFPTAGHLASWAGRCPGNNVTGGRRHSGGPTKRNRWLGEVLIECAWAAPAAETPTCQPSTGDSREGSGRRRRLRP